MHLAEAGKGALARPRWPTLGLEQVVGLVTAAAIGLWAFATLTGEPAASKASGDERTPVSVATGPEWLLGGYGGVPYTLPSDITFEKAGATNLTAHNVNWDGRPFKSPIYYGLRALRWGDGGSTGAMVDFLHSKAISQREQTVKFSGTRDGKPAPASAKIGETFKHLEFSHGHNMLTLNGMYRLGSIMPWLRPYVGAGAGVALPHTEVQFLDENQRTYEYQYAGPVGQAMVGLEFKLPRVTLFLEYKFTAARYEAPLTGRDSRGWGAFDLPNQVLGWLRGEKPAFGTAKTTLVSHQVVAGAAARLPASVQAAP